MGLSIAPVAPTGLLTVVGTALFGFIAELPFLITRYRNYGSRFLLAASGVIGLLTGLMDFVPNGGFNLEPVSQVLFLLLNTISGVLGMLVARALSRVLVNAGVLRGYAIANSTPEI
jgi:energy-coupling factor transport system substrate-specific component